MQEKMEIKDADVIACDAIHVFLSSTSKTYTQAKKKSCTHLVAQRQEQAGTETHRNHQTGRRAAAAAAAAEPSFSSSSLSLCCPLTLLERKVRQRIAHRES